MGAGTRGLGRSEIDHGTSIGGITLQLGVPIATLGHVIGGQLLIWNGDQDRRRQIGYTDGLSSSRQGKRHDRTEAAHDVAIRRQRHDCGTRALTVRPLCGRGNGERVQVRCVLNERRVN